MRGDDVVFSGLIYHFSRLHRGGVEFGGMKQRCELGEGGDWFKEAYFAA